MSGVGFPVVLVVGVLVSVAGDKIAARNPSFAVWWYGCWTAGFVATSALAAAEGLWGWAAWLGVCAVLHGVEWWRHNKRRRRGRAPRSLGVKSAALIAALVQKARQAARPRAVPDGAR